jgi:hypothetical protein
MQTCVEPVLGVGREDGGIPDERVGFDAPRTDDEGFDDFLATR